MKIRKDLSGKRFGLLSVGSSFIKLGNQTAWLCLCDCGASKHVRTTHLILGRVISCGCARKTVGGPKLRAIFTRHGKTKSSIYYIWRGMKKRCLNKTDAQYRRYGGRGISVCDRWMCFDNFYADMGDKPDGMSIDRINNDGNYEPSNCRWATPSQQASNRRGNHFITVNGATDTMTSLARKSGLRPGTASERIRRGMMETDAVTRPLMRVRK